MNETISVLLSRRAVRAYQEKPVSREDLETIVSCGTYAATGRNCQAFHFTVVTDRALLDRISEATRRALRPDAADYHNFHRAPAVIFTFGETQARDGGAIECANATENMAIAAKALGLGSCYLASHKMGLSGPEGPELCRALGMPEGFAPQFALAVGYAAQEPAPAPRREGLVNWVEG